MGKRIPRRLKRFARQGVEPSEEAMIGLDENRFFYNPDSKSPKPVEKRASGKEIAAEIAMEEVQKFKEKHKRLPEKKEYNSISESIYAQLKNKEKRKKAIERLERKKEKRTVKKDESKGTEKESGKKRKHGRHGHRKEQTEEKGFSESKTPKDEIFEETNGTLSDEEIKKMSVEDLFSNDKKGKENEGFGEFEKTDNGEFSLEGLKEMEGKSDSSNKCPKCGAETKEVVFCPECGTAFCEKCAKKAEVLGDVKTFVCPGCSKKIKK